MKIYTRGGDKGRTSLVGGRRIAKSSTRLDAYGTTDELNSVIGWLRATEGFATADNGLCDRLLATVQHRIFNIGAYLATDPADRKDPAPRGLAESDVTAIENEIDRMDETLPPLRAFILPGGCEGASRANIARTVCRRAERRVAALNDDNPDAVHPLVLSYINRLSDYLFALGRYLNHLSGTPDIEWRQ